MTPSPIRSRVCASKENSRLTHRVSSRCCIWGFSSMSKYRQTKFSCFKRRCQTKQKFWYFWWAFHWCWFFFWPWKLREIALSEKLIISIKICFHENIEHVHQQFVWNPCLRCTFHYSLEENWSQLHGLIFCQIFDHSYLSAMCKRACLLFANSLMCLDVSSWSLTTVKDPFLLILIIIIIIMVFSQNWRIGWCDTHIVRFCQIFHNSYLSPMRKAACLMFAN